MLTVDQHKPTQAAKAASRDQISQVSCCSSAPAWDRDSEDSDGDKDKALLLSLLQEATARTNTLARSTLSQSPEQVTLPFDCSRGAASFCDRCGCVWHSNQPVLQPCKSAPQLLCTTGSKRVVETSRTLALSSTKFLQSPGSMDVKDRGAPARAS